MLKLFPEMGGESRRIGRREKLVAYRILVSAPVLFGFRSYLDLVGVGPRGFGDKA